jgi:hypothetical protein
LPSHFIRFSPASIDGLTAAFTAEAVLIYRSIYALAANRSASLDTLGKYESTALPRCRDCHHARRFHVAVVEHGTSSCRTRTDGNVLTAALFIFCIFCRLLSYKVGCIRPIPSSILAA